MVVNGPVASVLDCLVIPPSTSDPVDGDGHRDFYPLNHLRKNRQVVDTVRSVPSSRAIGNP